MDKIGTTTTTSTGISAGQIPESERAKSHEGSSGDQSVPIKQTESSTAAKSLQQEAASRKMESGLQATVRKEDLLTKLDGGVKNTQSVEKTSQKPLKSEAEIRELFQKKTFPAVKEAMAEAGYSINKTTCNTATGMLKNALELQGVSGVTIEEGPEHTYIQVKTKEGKTLVLDPTASQFFKDGTPIDQKLQKEGFVGTKDELKKMISDNLEHWNFPETWKMTPGALDAYRDKSVHGISKEDAKGEVETFQDLAERDYFSESKGAMKKFATEQAEWYNRGNLEEPFYGNEVRLKRGYELMQKLLKD